jgi:hypothetical protein
MGILVFTILIFIGIAFIGWCSWRFLRIQKEILVAQKAIIKVVLDVNKSMGTESHKQIIENLYAIYCAVFGVVTPANKWNGEEFEKSQVRDY